MIKVTRLNGQPLYLNALLIERVESFPDTAIILTNGKQYMVKETGEEVVKLITAFYKEIQLAGRLPVKEDEDNGKTY